MGADTLPDLPRRIYKDRSTPCGYVSLFPLFVLFTPADTPRARLQWRGGDHVS